MLDPIKGQLLMGMAPQLWGRGCEGQATLVDFQECPIQLSIATWRAVKTDVTCQGYNGGHCQSLLRRKCSKCFPLPCLPNQLLSSNNFYPGQFWPAIQQTHTPNSKHKQELRSMKLLLWTLHPTRRLLWFCCHLLNVAKKAKGSLSQSFEAVCVQPHWGFS